MEPNGRTKVTQKYKEIMENLGCEVIELHSLTDAMLKKIIGRNAGNIETMLIVVRKRKW